MKKTLTLLALTPFLIYTSAKGMQEKDFFKIITLFNDNTSRLSLLPKDIQDACISLYLLHAVQSNPGETTLAYYFP